MDRKNFLRITRITGFGAIGAILFAGMVLVKTSRTQTQENLPPRVLKEYHGRFGPVPYVTDTAGHTLYFNKFSKIGAGYDCDRLCEKKWRPFFAKNASKTPRGDPLNRKLNTFRRTDGQFQYAIGSLPLYYFAEDKKPRDIKGHNYHNAWSVMWAQ